MKKDKIGATVVTFNSEEYFVTLFQSIPLHKLDELVIVNGGKPYNNKYVEVSDKIHWIQHEENYGSAKSRNDGLKKLYDLGCDYMFCLEDDLICRNENIFDEYIKASTLTGLEYFHFVSYAWEVGPVGNRTPRLQVQYSPDVAINFYRHCCNELSMRTRKMYELTGEYLENMHNGFDIEWIKRASDTLNCSNFWWFSDISNSDDLIMNNPVAVSRLDGDGKRLERLAPDYEIFKQKHGMYISQVPDLGQEELIRKLKRIKP